MRRVMIGQMLLILCCIFYLIWWYRGFRPNVIVSRVGGLNGILLMITAALGLAGIFISMSHIPAEKEPKLNQSVIVLGGIILYVGLLLVTKLVFRRIVTTELILIVGWTVLELTVINRLKSSRRILVFSNMSQPAGSSACFFILCSQGIFHMSVQGVQSPLPFSYSAGLRGRSYTGTADIDSCA